MKVKYRLYAAISLVLATLAALDWEHTTQGEPVAIGDTIIQTGVSFMPNLCGVIFLASGLLGGLIVLCGKPVGRYPLVAFYLLQAFMVYGEGFRFSLDTVFSFDITAYFDDFLGIQIFGIDLFAVVMLMLCSTISGAPKKITGSLADEKKI